MSGSHFPAAFSIFQTSNREWEKSNAASLLLLSKDMNVTLVLLNLYKLLLFFVVCLVTTHPAYPLVAQPGQLTHTLPTQTYI